MGTWGHGNFENDTATDHIRELCAPLIDQIRKAASNDELMEPDEYDSEVMLANIEIVTVLAENIGRTGQDRDGSPVFAVPFPEPDEIKSWKAQYLKVWDGYIDDLEPRPAYKIKRRMTIEETFDNFIRVSGRT